jgi:hypothetical protein
MRLKRLLTQPNVRRSRRSILFAALIACLAMSGPVPAATTVTVSNDVKHAGVIRFGLNIGIWSWWNSAGLMMKNIIRNPGFENPEMSSVIIAAGNCTATGFSQKHWDFSWNNDTQGIGQPTGFWNNASYEIAYGPAAGFTGTVVNFTANPAIGVTNPWFVLDQVVPIPNENDIMYVRKECDGNYIRSINGDNGDYVLNDSVSYAPGVSRPGSEGVQSLAFGVTGSVYITRDVLYRDGDRSAGKTSLVTGEWTLRLWARAETDGDKIVVTFGRENATNFMNRRLSLTTNWQEYVISTNVPPGMDENREYSDVEAHPAIFFRIGTAFWENEGGLWIDDLFLGRTDQTNATVFSDTFVNLIKQYRPGTLRLLDMTQMGCGLKRFTDSPYARGSISYSLGSRDVSSYNISLGEFLELCRELRTTPWFCFSPTFSAADLHGLVDYLAGPTNTVYGAKRAVQGRIAPWTDEFDSIFVEFGNEGWGSAQRYTDPCAGMSFGDGIRLGACANTAYDRMRANTNFSEKIVTVIGGQNHYPGRQTHIEANSSNHDATAIAPYYFFTIPDYSNVEDLYGSLFAYPIENCSTGGYTRQSRDAILAGGNSTEPVIYEMNLYTLEMGDPPEAARNAIVTGFGAGLSLAHCMLHYLDALGIRRQCAYSVNDFSYRYDTGQYVRLPGMVRGYDGRINTKRPTWLSIETANRAVSGDLLTIAKSGDDPAWTQPPRNDLRQTNIVAYVQAFAFRTNHNYSIILFNLHRTNSLDVVLDVPGEPLRYATRHQLTASNIDANNESNESVRIVSSAITDFSDNYALALPPFSMTDILWSLPGGGVDTDDDGMPDWWEDLHFGNVTQAVGSAHGDSDIHDNFEEYVAATDPTNGLSFLRITRISNAPPSTVYFNASSNRRYTLMGCASLLGKAWSNVPGNGPRPGAGGADSMQDTNSAPDVVFYRIGVTLP